MPIRFGSTPKTINREAKLVSLPSPNPRIVTHTGDVTDGVANLAPVPKGTSKVLSRKTGTEVLTFATKPRTKHHCVLKAKSLWLRSQNIPVLSSRLVTLLI